MNKARKVYFLITAGLMVINILLCWTYYNIQASRDSADFWQNEYFEQRAVTDSILKGRGR